MDVDSVPHFFLGPLHSHPPPCLECSSHKYVPSSLLLTLFRTKVIRMGFVEAVKTRDGTWRIQIAESNKGEW